MRESTRNLISGSAGAVWVWLATWLGAPLWVVLLLVIGASGCLAVGMEQRERGE